MEGFLLPLLFSTLYLQIQGASLNLQLHPKHEKLISKLSNYRLIRPYRSTPDGDFLTYDLSSNNDDVTRRRRSTNDETEVDETASQYFVIESVDGEDMLLNLNKVTDLFSSNFVVEKLSDDGEIFAEAPETSCFYQGHVGNMMNTTVAISSCGGLSGVISVGNDEYIIEPVDSDQPHSLTDATDSHGTHIIYRTTDHEGHEEAIDLLRPIDLTNDEEGLDGDVTDRSKRYDRLLATDKTYYVKTMLVADKSLQNFHGNAATLYMATVMNVVNKIYAHRTLGLNIKFVIVKVVLLNQRKSQSIIQANGSPIASLRNANLWAAEQNVPSSDPNHFDMSIFITKTRFGASGYANVGEVCRQSLSAGLVLDREGLRSAFVVAHEAAHLLGVEHDNEEKSCRRDADSSAVMAAFVTSNFHNYYWSSCSRNQIYKKLRNGGLDCLEDEPVLDNEDDTYPGLQSTLDEQCRFNYGPAAAACPREDLNQCQTLYCITAPGNVQCKAISRTTRPLEGTPCGSNKWCIQGQCLERSNFNNPEDTIYEWHAGEWSPCSLTCGGAGIKAREITCREVVYDKSGRLAEISEPTDNVLCHPDLKPPRKAECLSRACSADWITGHWSECDVTCGTGTKTRKVTCDIPQGTGLEHRCWGSKPDKVKSCSNEDCLDTGVCVPIPGPICKAKNYERYCRMPGYVDECCYTCEEQAARVASWKGKRKRN